MTQVKAFAMLVVVAFAIDMAAFDGAYRHSLSRHVHHLVYEVSGLHWTGFVGR